MSRQTLGNTFGRALALSAAVAFGAATAASGASQNYWIGSVDSYFATGSNWDQCYAPDATKTDYVMFQSDKTSNLLVLLTGVHVSGRDKRDPPRRPALER